MKLKFGSLTSLVNEKHQDLTSKKESANYQNKELRSETT